jgi:hypothetical protein
MLSLSHPASVPHHCGMADDDESEPAASRVPTKPLPSPLSRQLGSIEVDFLDGEAVAQFLELVAELARKGGRIKIVLVP